MGDYQNIINTAVEEATMRGLAEGMEKGMEKERLANAAKLKELGVDPAIISQATGLTLEEVSEL